MSSRTIADRRGRVCAMPHLPTALATGTERLFGRPTEVHRVQRLSDGLCDVTLVGDIFATRRAVPGAEVEFRVAPTELRHYTLAGVDPPARTARLIMHTRGNGPGRAWCRQLDIGQRVIMFGPGKSAAPTPARAVLADASALGLAIAFAGLAERSAPGVIEVHPDDLGAAAALLPGTDILAANAATGAALTGWLHAHPEISTVPHAPAEARPGQAADAIHLAGHAQTCVALREILMRRGAARRLIRIHPYWADGKIGL